ncbi:TPA: hypothetical protein I8370_001740 [Klebsiella oxytoca]|nr:hypothetical protein [Klebsiella oxytoca]
MMNKFVSCLSGVLIMYLLTLGTASGACSLDGGQVGVGHVMIPLQGNLEVIASPNSYDSGVENIFTLNLSVRHNTSVSCGNTMYRVYEITDIPQGVLSSKTFPTELENVEVYFSSPFSYPASVLPVVVPVGALESVDIRLRKIDMGRPASGGVINGSSLPSGRFYVTESPTGEFDNTAVEVFTFSFSGSLTVHTPTCNAVNKDVFLGDYTPNDFSGPDTGTAWVDAGFTVVCDSSFYGGYYSMSNITRNDEQSTWQNNIYSQGRYDNAASISISPVYGWNEDDDNYIYMGKSRGVMHIASSVGRSASGISIQLSDTPEDRFVNFNDPEGADRMLVTATDNITPGMNSFTIPLFARYLQTQPIIKPGEANGRVIYTLNYK